MATSDYPAADNRIVQIGNVCEADNLWSGCMGVITQYRVVATFKINRTMHMLSPLKTREKMRQGFTDLQILNICRRIG